MALVAYDYGSASEDEEEEAPTPSNTQIIDNTKTDAHRNIFSSLPNTKSFKTIEIPEHVIEDFIPKPAQVKPKVKITIPSLSDFQNDQDSDEDEPSNKRNKPSPAGSGLIAILPPVKGSIRTSTSFVPKVLTTRKKPTGSTLIPRNVAKSNKPKPINRNVPKSNLPKPTDSDTEDESELPETFDDAMWEKVCGRPKAKRVVEEPSIEQPVEIVNIAPEPEKPYDGLDNQAFKELIGKSKRPVGNIRLIDVNEEEILADKDLWMAKAMTDPEMAPKATEDPVDPTKRKKHHITYLAQQARANEQDLKTAWALSKNNRLASRSKYGF